MRESRICNQTCLYNTSDGCVAGKHLDKVCPLMNDAPPPPRGMTNFEKFKESISIDEAAKYFSVCFEGHCDACPALEKCRLVEDDEEISCIDVFRNWLKEEADV